MRMVSMNLLDLIRRNLVGKPFRNVAMVLCFALISGSVISANFLVSGSDTALKTGIERMGADLMVVPKGSEAYAEDVLLTGTPSNFVFSMQVLDRVAAVEGVELACPQIYIATLSNQACCAYPVELIGYNQSLDFTVKPWLESQLGRPLEKDEIFVGGEIIGDIPSSLIFYGHEFTIAGRLEKTGMGVDCCIFIRDVDAYVMAAESVTKAVEPVKVLPGQISSVLVRIAPDADEGAVVERIEASVEGTSVISTSGLAQKVSQLLDGATQPLFLSSAAVALASVPLMAAITSMIVNERRGEIGLMRAVGATKRLVFGLIMTDSVMLAVIGSIVGVAVTLLLLFSFNPLITSSLGIPFMWPQPEIALLHAGAVIAVAVGIGAVSALIPAIRSTRIEPYEAIRAGEE